MRFHLRSPTDDGVDRPDLEAPQGVKATGTNRPKQTHQTPQQTGFGETTQTTRQTITSLLLASTTQYLTQHQQPEYALSVCRWPIAAGKRPDPFRTRKLSLPALMVLQPGGCGRVRNRRHQTTTNNSITSREGPRHHTKSRAFTAFSPQHNPHTRPSTAVKIQTRKYRPAGRMRQLRTWISS